MKTDTEQVASPIPTNEETTARREFIARLGRFALYTTPIFLELSRPSASAFASTVPEATATAVE